MCNHHVHVHCETQQKLIHSKEYDLELLVEVAGGEIVKAGSVVSSTKDQVLAIIIATIIIIIITIMTVIMTILPFEVIIIIVLIILLPNFPSIS